MAQVKVFYDPEGNTLTVWFGTPKPSADAKGPAGRRRRLAQVEALRRAESTGPGPRRAGDA